MKKSIRIVCAILALLMAVLPAACGGGKPPAAAETTAAATTATTAAATTEAAKQETTTAAAKQEETAKAAETTTAAATTSEAVTAGSTTAAPETQEQEPEREYYKLQIINNAQNITTSADTAIGRALLDKFNVEFEYIPFSGDYRAHLNLMLAGGDYPEILRIEQNDIVMSYAQAGALVDLEPFIAESKWFKDRYKVQIPFFRMASGLNKAYSWQTSVPADLAITAEFNDVIVRSDALEAQNWKIPLKTSEYVEFLKQALIDFPETDGMKTLGMCQPMAEPWGMQGTICNMYEKGGPMVQSGGMRSIIWNVDEQRYEFRWMHEYVLESYRFFNQLHRAGVLDSEMFTDFSPQYEEKFMQGRAMMGWYNMPWKGPNARQREIGHPERQYVRLPIISDLQYERNQIKRYVRVDSSRPFDSYAISTNAKHPERLFEILDWACSDEGQILLQSGVEGKHYTYEGGKRRPTQEFVDNNSVAEWSQAQGFGVFASFFGRFQIMADDGVAYNLAQDPVYRDELLLSDREKQVYFDVMGWKTSIDFWLENGRAGSSSLPNSIVIDPATELGMLQQKIVEHWVKYGALLIMADTEEEFERVLQEGLDGFWALDPDRVKDEATRMYNEAKATMDSLAF